MNKKEYYRFTRAIEIWLNVTGKASVFAVVP